MIQKLISFLYSLKIFNLFKKKEIIVDIGVSTIISLPIPIDIEDKERICRSVFSEINLDKNGNLRSNTFRTPANKDEVSVNRLDYTTPDFCKVVSKKSENSSNNRNYFGLAVLLRHEIINSKCNVIYTPITSPQEEVNLAHADITIGYIPSLGETLQGQYKKKIDDLTKLARLYKDPNPLGVLWEGGDLI